MTTTLRLGARANLQPRRLYCSGSPSPITPKFDRRSFLSFPGSSSGSSGSRNVTELTASRILPYAHLPLYDIIVDVDSYSSFVPYCSHSLVTAWSEAELPLGPNGPSAVTSTDDSMAARRLPSQAEMNVGWGGFDETFTSRLICVPGESIEATSGEAAPVREGSRQQALQLPSSSSSVFHSLFTRWSLEPLRTGNGSPSTKVDLVIRYQFNNPLYAAVSSAVSDRVASLMVEAFEKRARQKLGTRI